MARDKLRKQKVFRLGYEACEALERMKAKTGQPEQNLVEQLILRGDKLFATAEKEPILDALRVMNDKLDEILERP